MKFHQALLFLALLSSSNQHEIVKRDTSQAGQKKVVCYYTNWSVYRPGTAKFSPQNINPYLCTHLIYAFGGLDRENGLRPYDKYQDIEQGGYAKFTGLKSYNKALKTMLAIGGWNEGSARFSPLVADEERRKEFVKNVVKFLRVNHFDGLDLDWEYPTFRDGGKAHDKENYAQLVQELREEFERESSKTGRVRLLLTMAVPAGIEYIDKGYDIPKLNKYLDFMNILSYDYHSAFEPSVNHHSPLYSLEEESEYNYDSQLTIDATVKHYLMKGADANKLVLGIPTYGRSYTLFNEASTDLGSPADGPGEQGDATREKGYLAYYEICSKVKEDWNVVHPKDTAMGPYAYKGTQWVGYDDENIVRKKSQYVNEKQLGGIMIWSIDNDDFRGNCHQRAYPLIEAAKEVLLGKAAGKQALSAGRSSKTSASKPGKLKNQRSSTTPAAPQSTPTVTTPEPPTTPDPGSDFVCKDEGFFPHPRDCKKYFWCLDSGPSNLGIVAHQFTCPSGLFFNKAADSCDFARNVICKKKSTTTTSTTTTSTTTTTTATRSPVGRVTSSGTSTTPLPPSQEDYEDDSEEDPQTIKQLINLIKKLGGVDELEKQLEGTAGSDATTPSISKTLYDRVINKGTPKYQTLHRNGPSGPQNEGLTRETVRAPYRRDKPQYVTIRRERPSTTTASFNSAEYADIDEIDEPDDSVPEERPNYKELYHTRHTDKESDTDEDSGPTSKSERHFRPKYQPAERFRPKHQHTEDKKEASTLKYTNLIRSRPSTLTDHTSSTSKYVTLHRQKPQQQEELGTTVNYGLDEEEVSEEQLGDLETTTTSTSRPRVKVSALLTTTPRILTSTRVVTQIVEGSTQRQRVPLHRLHELLLDADNLIKSSTKSDLSAQTTKKRIFNRLIRKRPSKLGTSAISSSTTTAHPLSQSNQQIRPPAEDLTESHNVTTISKKRGHGFVPSRTHIRTNSSKEQNNYNRRSEVNRITSRFRSTTEKATELTEITNGKTRLILPKKSGTESSNSFTKSIIRAKRPTDEDRADGSDPLLSREFSRESNIVRRPVFRHVTGNASTEQTKRVLFSLPHISSTTALNTVNYSATVNVMRIKNITTTRDLVVTEQKKNETKFGIPSNTSRQHKSDDHPFTIKELPSSTTSQPITLVENNTESDVGNIAETTAPTTERITTEYFYTTIAGDAVQESNQLVSQTIKRNKTKRILRRKLIVHEKNYLTTLAPTTQTISKGRNKIKIIRRLSDKRLSEKRPKIASTAAAAITQKKVITSRGKTKYYHSQEQKSSVDERRKVNEAISTVTVLPTESPAVHQTPLPVKRKRILIRGKKTNKQATNLQVESSIDNGQLQTTSQLQKREDGKVHRVVLKKITRDLAVGETGVPISQRNTYEIESPKKPLISRGSLKLKDSLLKEELEFTKIRDGNTSSEIGRVRRPVNKRLISRGSTSTSTSAPTTASTQRSTALTLAHRLNKFKIDKNLPRPSIISSAEGNRTTLRPRKSGFRRVVRPIISSQNVAEDSQLGESYSRSISKDKKVTFEKEQFPGDPSSFTSEESERDGHIDETVEEQVADAEITGQTVSAEDDGSSESVTLDRKQSSSLPDLANVAVAAIHSLATSIPPTESTVKYKSTLTYAAVGKDVLSGKARPSSRPGRPFRPSTKQGITRSRSSSPRPFSKNVQQSTSPTRATASPHRTSLIYEDYDADYYVEPVDLPLSGKVRIHTDGYIECLDIGNFPHPFSCRKFISCAKMENGRLLGWEYTCPKGLSFDPIGGICNWNAGLGCKE